MHSKSYLQNKNSYPLQSCELTWSAAEVSSYDTAWQSWATLLDFPSSVPNGQGYKKMAYGGDLVGTLTSTPLHFIIFFLD
jgi:hypothetical protein